MDEILQRLNGALNGCLSEQLLVLADRLEELGEYNLAIAYRWLSSGGYCPLRYGNRWHWRRPGEALPLMHRLPAEVTDAIMARLPCIGYGPLEFASMDAAYRAAAHAYVMMWDPAHPIGDVPIPEDRWEEGDYPDCWPDGQIFLSDEVDGCQDHPV